MYKILYIVIFLFSGLLLSAQDTILLRDGHSISAKIFELNPSSVKFIKFENQNGPQYVEDKKNIVSIKYSNGLIDTFPLIVEPIEAITYSFPTFSKIINTSGRLYYVNSDNIKLSRPLGFKELSSNMENFSKTKNLPDLTKLVLKTKKNSSRQKGFFLSGIICFPLGVGILMESYMISTAVGPNGNDDWAATGAAIGATFVTTGLSFEVISIVNAKKKKKCLNQAIMLYNENL